VFLTLSAAAIFVRYYIMDAVEAHPNGPVPAWLRELTSLGFVDYDARAERLSMTSVGIARDAVLYSLPIAAGLPAVIMQLTVAGAVAAALGSAAAGTVTLGNILAEDLVGGLSWETEADETRLLLARGAGAIAALLAAALATLAPADPLRLILWALALTGSAAFPVLVLSIWWKRLNAFGALAGMAAGFAVATLAIIAGEAHWIGLDGALAGALGIPAATLATVAVSLGTPAPGRHLLEIVSDIRIPGGEITSDREARLARLKKRQRT